MGSRQGLILTKHLALLADRVLRVGWRRIVHHGRLHSQVSLAVHTHMGILMRCPVTQTFG